MSKQNCRVLVEAVLGMGLVGLAGCQGAHADATTPPGGPPVAVTVSISSATLGDDCGVGTTDGAPASGGSGRMTPPSEPASTTPTRASAKPSLGDSSGMAVGGAPAPGYAGPGGRAWRSCRQTSLQLAVVAAEK